MALLVRSIYQCLHLQLKSLPADASDFERLLPIRVSNKAKSIRLFTANDDISLEYDDRVRLVFTPDNPVLVPALEGFGQYIRTTATVRIIDDDCEW